jgi:hypothetical protein
MCADSGRICADNSALSKRAVSGVTETAAEYVQTTFRKCTELSAMFKRAANCDLCVCVRDDEGEVVSVVCM